MPLYTKMRLLSHRYEMALPRSSTLQKGHARCPCGAKVQRMRGGIAKIVRKAFAIDGMPLVLAAACTGVL